MQVSIYLSSPLIKKLDRQAEKNKKSRSRYIQMLLERVFFGKKEKSVFDEVFGALDRKIADTLLHTISESRRNSPRFG